MTVREIVGGMAGRCMGRVRSVLIRHWRSEEGATLVETAMASILLLAMLFGVIEISILLYTYHYISEAARETTRYAAVRGSNSCSSSPTTLTSGTQCNIGPGSSGNPLQVFAQSLGYPGINPNDITVTATWWTASYDSSGNIIWTTPCTGGATCNDAGNEVKVVVNYAFPLSIPFWRATTVNMSSTSNMVISN